MTNKMIGNIFMKTWKFVISDMILVNRFIEWLLHHCY